MCYEPRLEVADGQTEIWKPDAQRLHLQTLSKVLKPKPETL